MAEVSPDVQATIHSLDATGGGVGEVDGSPVRVMGVLPGETATVRVEHEDREGLKHARLVVLGNRSPDRIEPACTHFLECGGCDYLHLDDEAELAVKRKRVAEALERPLESVDHVLASPRSLHYRAVAKLVFGPRGKLGSYAPRSHRVVDMRGCKVHAPVVERVAEMVRRAILDGVSTDGARYLVLRAALPNESVHATLVTYEPDTPAESALLEVLARSSEVVEVWRHVNQTVGDAIVDPEGETICLHRGSLAVGRVGTAEQHLATGAFAQVNPGAAERLYRRVSDLVEPDGRRVLDLYSGSGGISLTLVTAGAEEVLGIERTPSAVEAARKAASQFRGRAHFEVAPAENVKDILLSKHAGPVSEGGGGGFPVWVVNPPRKGLGPEVIYAIRALLPERLIYVSCHPDRLARDIGLLSDRYACDVVSPVDMFPQTHHVETVARLELLRDAGP